MPRKKKSSKAKKKIRKGLGAILLPIDELTLFFKKKKKKKTKRTRKSK